jgi:hypothetical protein
MCRNIFPGSKARGVLIWLLTSAEVTNKWLCTSPPRILRGVVLKRACAHMEVLLNILFLWYFGLSSAMASPNFFLNLLSSYFYSVLHIIYMFRAQHLRYIWHSYFTLGKSGRMRYLRTLEMCAVAKMVGRPNKNDVGGSAGGRCIRMDDATNTGFESGILRRRDHVGDTGLRRSLLLSG